MGCTQSKSTNEAVIDGGKAGKALSPTPVQTPEASEQPGLAASHTVSSDDHDVGAGANNEGANNESPKTSNEIDTDTVIIKDETTTVNTETNDNKVDNVASPEGTTAVTTTTKTVHNAQVVLPKKSPRRSPRQRSSSSGVNEMAAMGEEAKEGVPKQPSVEPLLQPVVPKKVSSPPEFEPVLEVEKKQQPAMDNAEVAPNPEAMDNLPVVPKEEIENKDAVVNAEDPAPKDPTPAEDLKQEIATIQRTPSMRQKFCSGCFTEEASGGAPFKVCAKCKVVSYCGRDCQVQHWKVHKKACCKNPLDISNSQLLGQSWARSDSPTSSVNSSDSFMQMDETMRKSKVHDDAVKELEAVLRRLRSEDSENENNDKPAEEATMEEDAKPSANDGLDPIEAAREEILDEAVAETLALDGTLLDVAPRPPTPVADENTPILKVPEVRTCVGCNSVEKAGGAFKSCAKCRVVCYCNRKCQKGHWKEHKKVCCKSDPKRASLLQVKDPSLNPIQAS